MEAPSWIFKNSSYFLHFNINNKKIILFSDFEHNWNLFQYLTNDNIYYFYLKSNAEYNFNILYKTYQQKLKHINLENINFIINHEDQEKYINNFDIKFNYIYKNKLEEHFNQLYEIIITESQLSEFLTYTLTDAIDTINTKVSFNFNPDNMNKFIKKNIIIRNKLNQLNKLNKISFFGTSVTGQSYSYVDCLQKKANNLNIIKKGYSGCQINQAIWLVNEIIDDKPDICILEWITSSSKYPAKDLEEYLSIIINKLLKNNIIPIFVYLYKTDIENYYDMIEIYEQVANYYDITSFHQYRVIKESNIDNKYFLKDTCHTVFQGSNLYGEILNIMFNYLFNDFKIEHLNLTSEYNNIKILNINNNNNYEIFNNKKYYTITDELIINNNIKKIIALNILYYKNNGFIYINDYKLQTWDRNCYYKRYGYINLNINNINNSDIIIKISQEKFDTSDCKYDCDFNNNKYLMISEIIYL